MQITPSSNLIAALSALQQPQRAAIPFQPLSPGQTLPAAKVNGPGGVLPIAPTLPTQPVLRPAPVSPPAGPASPSDPAPTRPPLSPLGRFIDIRV
ncbi:MAG TPA: hypothetical protein VEU47_01825 [Candidatus Cybelea sp.]|nr:hypothetical protein [Candidatus Cybelea sp.]